MSQPPIRALLVEDNPADARLVKELLSENDARLELEHVDGLQAALQRLEASGISVVLLDLGLKDSQGLDTLVRLRAGASQLPIIVLTGLDDDLLAIRSVREGAQDYLVKGQLDGMLLLRSITYAIERKELEEERNRLLRNLRESARDIFHVQEEERRRVAYELHDGVIQLVTAADMRLEGFLGRFRPRNTAARQELAELSRQLKNAVREGRAILSQLRPSVLDDFGPAQALRHLLEDIAVRENWQWDLKDSLAGQPLEPLVATAVYRISQEALNNARKHAEAQRVEVSLEVADNAVRVEVRDWGRGFAVEKALAAPRAAREGLGLFGMTERAQLLGGSCCISSTRGAGTSVLATIPLTSTEATGTRNESIKHQL